MDGSNTGSTGVDVVKGDDNGNEEEEEEEEEEDDDHDHDTALCSF